MAYRILSMCDVTACPNVFDSLKDIGEVTTLPPRKDLFIEHIGKYHVYVASLHLQIDRAMLQHARCLHAIATPSTGVDHLDVATMQELGVKLISLRSEYDFLSNITATAEMAWCLLLAVARRLPAAFDAVKQGDWARDRFRGHQLSGKTLGILGYGRLGRIVAQYGMGFRMRVLATDVRQIEAEPNVEMVDCDRLLAESDVLSVHIHLTEENRDFINREMLAKMRPGAVLINTSRGAIIDETALLEALENGNLAGAGLDVIEGEWREDLDRHPLIRYANAHDNLIISPHLGGVTYESQQMAYARTVENLAQYLKQIPTGNRSQNMLPFTAPKD